MPLIARIIIAFFTILFLSNTGFAQTDKFSEDQKTLLKEALRVALVSDKSLPNYADLNDKEKVVLLDKMLSFDEINQPAIFLTSEVIPDLGEVKLALKTETEIKDLKRKKDLYFVRVAQIKQPTSDFGLVHVLGQWDLGVKSRKKGFQFKEARGYSLLFKKENGTWKFQRIINTFPNFIEEQNQPRP